MTEREAVEVMLMHQDSAGVQACLAYFECRTNELRDRLESAGSEAVPRVQGQLREVREFLRNFIPVSGTPRTGGYA